MARKSRANKVRSGGRKRPLKPPYPVHPATIDRLGKYFDVLYSLLRKDETFWFRGHGDFGWTLTPSALRHTTASKRNKALQLVSDFKRCAEMNLERPPARDEELKWVQLAQHYGLPTRLLDWTKNASIALYFACVEEPKEDGAVFVLDPTELNRDIRPKDPRIFDPNLDNDLIEIYLKLGGKRNRKGIRTIAINPIWNSARIMAQQGVFTIAGSKYFTLTEKEASSLVCVMIGRQHKKDLLGELERIGVNEMSIFPELEHMCNYLKNSAGLGEESD